MRSILEEALSAISKLADAVRPVVRSDDFQLPKFRELLFRVATRSVVESRQPQADSSELVAFQSLLTNISLPAPLNGQVESFVEVAKSPSIDHHVLLPYAGEIAQSTLLWL